MPTPHRTVALKSIDRGQGHTDRHIGNHTDCRLIGMMRQGQPQGARTSHAARIMHMFDPSGAPRGKQSLTDSPWFWAMVFSAMGVVLLLAISPKYAQRQGRLELQYQARQEIARRQVEGSAATRESSAEGSAVPPGPGELIIPLWPLVLLFAVLFAIAAGMLYRAHRAIAGSIKEENSVAKP
jgi:hypothetical protein